MSYGAGVYGVIPLGGLDSEDSGMEVSPPDLMGYLPAYYHSLREMIELQGALSQELGEALTTAADLLRQFFVSTATWGLSWWEKELGLVVDPSMSSIWRREILLSKIRGHGTVTKQMVQETAAAFSGGDVAVIEYPDEYRFVVQFIGTLGIPPNMAGFIQMIERIKPAHLSCSFQYTYTAWNMLDSAVWSDFSSTTWNELRVYEE